MLGKACVWRWSRTFGEMQIRTTPRQQRAPVGAGQLTGGSLQFLQQLS